MTFDQLKLCMAIHQADLGGGDRPSSSARLEAAAEVMHTFLFMFGESRFPYSIDDVETWRLSLRKNKETQIKTEIARVHGLRCFWAHRGIGPCSNDAEAGHIVARCHGGELSIENAMIECRAHNNDRRERSIEQYLADKRETGGSRP